MSKKTLISAVTAALVVGAASTTFAAANPFSDVPADSWAYDAVTTLAADGVVDGYPNGTYQGQNTMTRYEMAQIVARAMAKTDLDKADKALVDKLAAEFAEELDNLGVRVADLEKKSDNVKWGGRLRYRYYETDTENKKNEKAYSHAILRLEPKAFIGNSGWTANTRIEYNLNFNTSSNTTDVKVDRAWVEGPLFGGKVQAGKFPVFTGQGMIADDNITGASYSFGSSVFNTSIAAGRYDASVDDTNYDYKNDNQDITSDYYGVEFNYTPNNKLALNAGYTQFVGIEDNSLYINSVGDNNLGIWYAGGRYAFNDKFAFVGEYSGSDADEYDRAYDVELQYKGANKKDAGSWGLYAGYRDFETNAVVMPTYFVGGNDQKGFVAGISYIPAENIVAQIEYMNGEIISTGADYEKIFGQIDFFF